MTDGATVGITAGGESERSKEHFDRGLLRAAERN